MTTAGKPLFAMKTKEMSVQEILMWMLDHDPKAAGDIAAQFNRTLDDVAWFANWKNGETRYTQFLNTELHGLGKDSELQALFGKCRAIHLLNKDPYEYVRVMVRWTSFCNVPYIYVPRLAVLIARDEKGTYSRWFLPPDGQGRVSTPGMMAVHALLEVQDCVPGAEESEASEELSLTA